MDGRSARQRGFTLIETLVVIIIIGVLAAIAIPMYLTQRDKAKEASLKESAHIVQVDAAACLADGQLSTTYLASGGAPTAANYIARAKTNLSNALEAALEGGVESSNGEGLVNPYSGKKSIINLSSASLSAANANPAVFLTNAAGCRYASFQTQTVTIRGNLKGTVIACWNTLASVNGIELYYVDRNGTKSATCVTLKF